MESTIAHAPGSSASGSARPARAVSRDLWNFFPAFHALARSCLQDRCMRCFGEGFCYPLSCSSDIGRHRDSRGPPPSNPAPPPWAADSILPLEHHRSRPPPFPPPPDPLSPHVEFRFLRHKSPVRGSFGFRPYAAPRGSETGRFLLDLDLTQLIIINSPLQDRSDDGDPSITSHRATLHPPLPPSPPLSKPSEMRFDR